MVQFNFEYIFPLIQKAGIKGLVFFDAGNAYQRRRLISGICAKVWALGIRWYSPMGPLRLEWGYNINPKPGEDTNNWDFSIGTFF